MKNQRDQKTKDTSKSSLVSFFYDCVYGLNKVSNYSNHVTIKIKKYQYRRSFYVV